MKLDDVLNLFPENLHTPMQHFAIWVQEDMGVSHEDFCQLKESVQDLAEAQIRTGSHVEELVEAQKELTEAQKRTEFRVEELTEAQKRTEFRVEELTEAQKRTEFRVEELTEAQKRTEFRVEELAKAQKELTEAQKKTEVSIKDGFQKVYDLIAALGSRWGIQTETAFRNAFRGVLKKTDYTVSRGYYGGREVDIIIQGDNLHILFEITSSLRKGDVSKYIASADDYETQTGIAPSIIVAASHVNPSSIPEIMASARPIELYSADEESEMEQRVSGNA